MLTQLFGRKMHMIAYHNYRLPLLFILKYFFGQKLLLSVSAQNNFDTSTYKRKHPCVNYILIKLDNYLYSNYI